MPYTLIVTIGTRVSADLSLTEPLSSKAPPERASDTWSRVTGFGKDLNKPILVFCLPDTCTLNMNRIQNNTASENHSEYLLKQGEKF